MRWTIATILFLCSPLFNAQSISVEVGPAAPKASGSQGQVQQQQGQQQQVPQQAPPAQNGLPKSSQDQGTQGGSNQSPKGQSPIGQPQQQPKNAPNAVGGKSGKGDGYEGYSLQQKGDPGSTHYETANTKTNDSDSGGIGNVTLAKDPDVHLNASLHVGEISLVVLNISAKINLDAQVKGLLTFNAGVDVHIDRVRLLIQGVEARVLLEARLGNLVAIISDVLDSIDLNPIIATLANGIQKVVNTTVGQLTQPIFNQGKGKSNRIEGRSVKIEFNILYSVNDYTGSTHTNRILAQNGEIYDEYLDNQGHHHGSEIVGYYDRDMVWNGHNKTVSRNGEVVSELEYVYHPFPGLDVVAAVYINSAGRVVATQVLSEAYGGGSTTIENPELKKRRR